MYQLHTETSFMSKKSSWLIGKENEQELVYYEKEISLWKKVTSYAK